MLPRLADEQECVREDLLLALSDDDNLVRRAAAVALSRDGNDKVADRLVKVLREAPELWQEASSALAAIRPAQLEDELIAILAEATSSRTRRGAARALGGVHAEVALFAAEDPLHGYEDESGRLHPLF